MNLRLVGLSAVAVVLGGVLVAQSTGWLPFGMGGSEGPAPVAARTGTADAKLNPLSGLDPASYASIVDRPLFNPSRQARPPEPPPPPPAVVEQPAEPPPPPPPSGPGPDDYKLLGVSAGPGGRVAALRVAASGEVLYLRKGAAVDSWSVTDIGDRSVAIGTPDNAVTYSLFEKKEGDGMAGASPPGGAPPAPGQPPVMPSQLGMPALPAEQSPPPSTAGQQTDMSSGGHDDGGGMPAPQAPPDPGTMAPPLPPAAQEQLPDSSM